MSRPPRPLPPAAVLPLLLLVVVLLAPTAVAGDAPTLDGKLDEASWSDARALEVAGIEVPALDSVDKRSLHPTVRVQAAAGYLWIGVAADEPPGPGVGVALLLLPDGAPGGAAGAVAIAFAPQDVRAPRWVVHGPRGARRRVYRVRGAAEVGESGRWSLEVAIPFADLDLPSPQTPLRLGLAVKTRDPNLVAWSPPGAAFAGSGTWTKLDPPGAWPVEGDLPDAQVLAAEDAQDDERLLLWNAFAQAYRSGVGDLLQAEGHAEGMTADTSDETLRAALRAQLVERLEQISALRPDLAFAHVVRGEVLAQLGMFDEARGAFEAAERVTPGLREAELGLRIDVDGTGLARGPVGGPSDYDAAFQAVARAAESARGPIARDGISFGRGLLLLARGDFRAALMLLDPLAKRYPFHQAVVYAADRASRGRDAFVQEERYRELDAGQGELPRVRLSTTKGDVVLELFENDAANTVKNFVWLVAHGFYDDTPFDRTVPFLAAQVDARDPGWAIPTLRRPDTRSPGAADARLRRPFRGSVAMLSPVADAAGARFVILTGTAPDLDGELLPFGRVVEGQSAVDALEAGDRILRATVLRTREGVEYRPLTVEGTEAPAPPPKPR